jgi:hypothetical protein
LQKSIEITPWSGDGSQASRRVRLRDCSPHGLGFDDSEPLETGQQFVVRLDLGEQIMVLYTVRHCSQSRAGPYRIGAQMCGFVGLEDTDPDQVLASLIQQRLI